VGDQSATPSGSMLICWYDLFLKQLFNHGKLK